MILDRSLNLFLESEMMTLLVNYEIISKFKYL